MSASGPIENARRWLEEGRPSRALRALAAASAPALLRAEANLLAAQAWREQGFFVRAEQLYRKVLAENPRSDPALWVEAALGSAAGLRSLGRVEKARKRLVRASRLARAVGLGAFLPRIELEDVLIDRAAGLYARSLRRLSLLLRRHLGRKEWADAAFVLWAMGGAFRFKGELSASQRAFLRSLTLSRRVGDPVGQGYALFGLGGVTRIMGRLSESAAFYARAKRFFDGTDDCFGRAYAYCCYANALRQLGRLTQAEANYRKSHRLYARLGDEVDLAYVDWGLGKIYLQRSNVARAQAFLARALRAFVRHGEARGEVLSEIALAQALHAMGRTSEAERHFARGCGLARRHGIHAHLESFT